MRQNKESSRTIAPRIRGVARCYIRKSYVPKGQTGPASPEIQRTTLERKCQELGLAPEWYQDVGGHNSGLSDERPDWQRLLADMRRPDTAAVLVYSWEFAARSVRLLLRLVDDTDAAGVRFISASDNIDTRTADGRFQVTILASVNEHYARRTGEKRAASIDYLRREQGRHYGFPPFGTERVKKDNERVLVPSQKTQPNGTDYDALVWLYQKWNVTRRSIYKLALDLNAAGWQYRGQRGQLREWTSDAVRRTLELHWIYAGFVVVGESHRDVRELLKGSHGELLPNELTAPVAKWLAGTRKLGPRQRQPSVYFLTGLLYCECGERLQATVLNGRRSYRHMTSCPKKCRFAYDAERIETIARQRLAGLEYPETINAASGRALLQQLAGEVGNRHHDVERIEQALERIEYLFVNGKIDSVRYEQMRLEYLAQMPQVLAERANTPAPDLPTIGEALLEAPPEMVRDVARELYARITVGDWESVSWQAQEWCKGWA